MSWIDITFLFATAWCIGPVIPGSNRACTRPLATPTAVRAIPHMSLSAHTGTHMDSPRHFIDGGITMEALPLDAVLGSCRVIEIHDQTAITAAELELHNLQRGERILFKTRNSTRSWQSDDFDEDFIYIAQMGKAYHRRRRADGRRGLPQRGRFKKDGVETHVELLDEAWIIEGLNLSAVEPGNYELACLPMKLIGSDGAPPERRCDQSNMRILVIGCGCRAALGANVGAYGAPGARHKTQRVFRHKRDAARARRHGPH